MKKKKKIGNEMLSANLKLSSVTAMSDSEAALYYDIANSIFGTVLDSVSD